MNENKKFFWYVVGALIAGVFGILIVWLMLRNR